MRRVKISRWASNTSRAWTSLVASQARAAARLVKVARRPTTVRRARPATEPGDWVLGHAVGSVLPRRYRLYRPPGLASSEQVPLLVMLHGCTQNAETFAASTRMNALALRHRFLVLYPEQDAIANPQRCWNWFDTRSGRAAAEAASIVQAIDQVLRLYPVDPRRVALAGMSAGASMAALLATRYPLRFTAVAMHSGVAPGASQSSATILSAMQGRRASAPLAVQDALPPLLIVHGSNDRVVSNRNAHATAELWAASRQASASAARTVQRGKRYPMQVTDYLAGKRLAVTLCEVRGLGHAWSGGRGGQAHADPRGPDASRMLYWFVARGWKIARGVVAKAASKAA